MPSQNPFFVGGPVPPEFFVGRRTEISRAFDQIANRSHLAVFGSAGMGKSSFLRALAQQQVWQERGMDFSEAVIVMLNCRSVQPFRPEAFCRQILSLLRETAASDSDLKSVIDTALNETVVGQEHVRKVVAKIGERNRFLLLLLDDYDAALETSDKYSEADMLTFLFGVRNLSVHSGIVHFSSVVMTSRRLSELGPKTTPSGSPWYNQYRFMALKPFSAKEANDLFAKLSVLRPLTPAEQDAIRELAGGNPALLEAACYLLYEKVRDDAILAIEEFARDLESETRQYYSNAWKFSSEPEQMLLTLIALSRLEGRLSGKRKYDLGDVDVIFSQMDRELRDLEDRGLIRRVREDDREVLRFSSSLMEWWIVKEIENSTPAELEQRQKVLLNINRQQVEKIGTVLAQVWQHKDAIKSVVGFAGQLAGAFAKGFGKG